jgi:hypothetical protein
MLAKSQHPDCNAVLPDAHIVRTIVHRLYPEGARLFPVHVEEPCGHSAVPAFCYVTCTKQVKRAKKHPACFDGAGWMNFAVRNQRGCG